jgi:hypothetical protein
MVFLVAQYLKLKLQTEADWFNPLGFGVSDRRHTLPPVIISP